jgi:hypothetical protein
MRKAFAFTSVIAILLVCILTACSTAKNKLPLKLQTSAVMNSSGILVTEQYSTETKIIDTKIRNVIKKVISNKKSPSMVYVILVVPIKERRDFTVSVDSGSNEYLERLLQELDKLEIPKSDKEEVQYEFLYTRD